MVGPTVLGRAMDLRELGMRDAGSALSGTIYFVRMLFMFFIGLELDLRYLRLNLRRSLAIACCGSALCFVLAVLAGPFCYGLMHPGQGSFHPDKIFASTALFALVLTSTASPVLIRIVTDVGIQDPHSCLSLLLTTRTRGRRRTVAGAHRNFWRRTPRSHCPCILAYIYSKQNRQTKRSSTGATNRQESRRSHDLPLRP